MWSSLHDRWGDPPHDTSPTWGPPPPYPTISRVFPYISHNYRYVSPRRAWFCSLFGLKMGLIHFAHFGLELGMVLEGTTGEYGDIVVSIPNEYQRNMWIWNAFEEIFCLCSKFCLAARSESGCGKWHFLVLNRVRIWRTMQHTPTKNFQEYSTPPSGQIKCKSKPFTILHGHKFQKNENRL